MDENISSRIDWDKVDGLIPAIIQCYITGKVLMLGFMNIEALNKTQLTKKVTFFSRSKNRLWIKGEASGHRLELIDLSLDCDQDSLLILAKPHGPTCHKGTQTCFDKNYHSAYEILFELEDTIKSRQKTLCQNSYVSNLLNQDLARIAQKVGEEGVEVVIAAMKQQQGKEELKNESADLIFHLLVLLQASDLSLSEVLKILAARKKS